MDGMNLNPNEGIEGVVIPQNEQEPVSANGEVATPQEKPVQSAEKNSEYAAVRREAQASAKAEAQKTIDAQYSEWYGAEYGIHTKADYDKAVAENEESKRIEAESQRMQASPELLKEIEDLKAFKNDVTTKEEARVLNERISSIDKEADSILEIAKAEGIEITKEQLMQCAVDENLTDLKKAYKLLKPDIDTKVLKENAIKEYIEGRRTGKIPVEGSGNTPVVTSEAPKTFDDALKGAREMLRVSKLFNK